MPKGVYLRTVETRKILSIAHRNKILSQEHKDRISKALKGIKKNAFSREHIENLKNSHRGKFGELSSHWIDGKIVHSRGYICLYNPSHPYAMHKRYIFEHRLVMEKRLGRYLKPKERIHHINFNKQDNRIENLMLFADDSEHKKYHNRLKEQEKANASQ